MNVEPVDFGDEVRQGVDLCLALAPIVRVSPILRELSHGFELDALRCIRDLFALRPLGRLDAIPQVDEVGLRSLEVKRTNSGVVGHCRLPLGRQLSLRRRKSRKSQRGPLYGTSRTAPRAALVANAA